VYTHRGEDNGANEGERALTQRVLIDRNRDEENRDAKRDDEVDDEVGGFEAVVGDVAAELLQALCKQFNIL